MNLVLGFAETLGIDQPGDVPVGAAHTRWPTLQTGDDSERQQKKAQIYVQAFFLCSCPFAGPTGFCARSLNKSLQCRAPPQWRAGNRRRPSSEFTNPLQLFLFHASGALSA